MQCIRGNNNRSPSITTSLSLDSLNEYFSKRINRKSLMRRSFEFVRKNIVRSSKYLLPKNSFKARKVLTGSGVSNNDLNNNRFSYNDSQILSQTTDQHLRNTYCDGGGDVFEISTDSDILMSNTNSRKQFLSNTR